MRASHAGTPGVPVSGLQSAVATTYTPTISWGGNTATAAGMFAHIPGALLLWVNITVTATPGSAACTIFLPAGYYAANTTLLGGAGVGVLCRGGVIPEVFTVISYNQIQSVGFPGGAVATFIGSFVVPTLT